jgi:pyruvate/2-oxoglutarate dehydrogenase complex dihydrolipoamide acyltransferase (E2) component
MSQIKAAHQTIPFPENRKKVLETLQTWAIKHPIHGLLEVDVTVARRYLAAHKASTGEALSFTGFIIYCVGQAVAQNKAVQARRNRRGELVLFEDVDLTTIVEVTDGEQKFPVTHVLRGVNRRTFREIHEEIRQAQAAARERHSLRGRQTAPKTNRRLFWALPGFARRIYYAYVRQDPQWMKRNVGTVALTAVGMFGQGGGWGVAIPVTPLFVTIGGIAEKPGVAAGKIEVREVLDLTLTFDHDVVDGAPAARFAACLKALIEAGPDRVEAAV